MGELDERHSPADLEAYIDEMAARAAYREYHLKREAQRPIKRLLLATSVSLILTPSVLFVAYAVDWSDVPRITAEGLLRFQSWPWFIGATVLTAYSFFYGVAAGLSSQSGDEGYRVAIGSFYAFWVWLPILLMYPGLDRLGLSSDERAIWASVTIGLAQATYAWFIGRLAPALTVRVV